MVGLVLASAIGGLLTSAALRIFSGRWERKVTLLLVISGIATIGLSAAISAVISSPRGDFRLEPLVILIIGDVLFASLCGYWIVKATYKSGQAA
jgi:hypothetical protein